MFENFTPSRPINLFRRPTGMRSPAILDRLDAIQEEVELHEQRRARDEAAANRFRLCIRAICLDLFVAMRADAELCVGIRRDNTGLSKNAAYPDFVSPRPFIAALDGLIDAGYVLQVTLGNEASGQSSRIKATHKLHDKLSFCIENAADIVDATDPIRLKVGKQGKPKKFLHYEDDTDTLRWRANLCRINDNNARYAVKLDISPKVRTALEVTRLAEAQEEARVSREPIQYQRIDINRIRLHRVFNSSDWTEGGRFYGPWWQSVPRAYRRHITINDKLTCEHDFSSLHLRLLYAAVGAPVPNHDDPYSSPYGEAHKSAVKKAFNVMLNAQRTPDQTTVPEFAQSQLNMT